MVILTSSTILVSSVILTLEPVDVAVGVINSTDFVDSKGIYEQAVLHGVIEGNEVYEKALKKLYDSDNDDWGWI